MDFIKVDLTNGHLIGRVFEVILKNAKVFLIDLVDNVHRQIVEVILNRMGALGSVTFAFIKARDLG